MSKHTPGPWRVDALDTKEYEDETYFPTLKIETDSPHVQVQRAICALDYDGQPIDRDSTSAEILANARLIAAAPEMLLALHLAEGIATGRIVLFSDAAERIRERIQAVIAKARGESEGA